MTQDQFDALINYINVKVANATGQQSKDSDDVILAHEWAEEACVDEPDLAVAAPYVLSPADPHF